MRHFHRTSLSPVDVLNEADRHFGALGLARVSAEPKVRQYSGPLGTMSLNVRMEGGHYTMVEAYTDQVGESRLDKNVKKFFVALHRASDPRHRIEAGY
jgi:hypothetical protein